MLKLALIDQVKLAEDMVARGSLTSSVSHLLQNYRNTQKDYSNINRTMQQHNHIVPPIMRDDHSPFARGVSESAVALENHHVYTTSPLPDMWTTWESHLDTTLPKWMEVYLYFVLSVALFIGCIRLVIFRTLNNRAN